MGVVDTQPVPIAAERCDSRPVYHCGRCHATVDVTEDTRRVRCPECGTLNGVPSRVLVTCPHCHHAQHVRLDQCDGRRVCVNCCHTLVVREIKLLPLRRRSRRSQSRHRHSDGAMGDSVVVRVLLYIILAATFLVWLSRQ